MENQPLLHSKEKGLALHNVVLLMGILFVSFNLRPAITAVGPLVGSIRVDVGISNGLAGLLTTIPLIAFALLSFFAPKLGYRFGNELMVFFGLLTLLVGIIIRSMGLSMTVFTGTALVGIGIAISNVLLPSIVKSKFPSQIGLMTGLYTTSMCVFAAIGSGLSVPLAHGLHLGWQKSLAVWAFLTVVAVLMWIPQLKNASPITSSYMRNIKIKSTTIWRSKLAWQVTIFMGLQSFLFYSLIAWLPEILSNSGLSMSEAGWMVSIMQLAGLPMALLTPIYADRFSNQKGIVWLIGVFYLIGIIGITITDSVLVLTCSVVLIGLGQGASISLALTLIGLRSAHSKQAAELSGMSQSIGYSLAAIGPLTIGMLLDVTKTPSVTFVIFVFIIVIMVIAGLGAGKNKTV
ncbi:CynX/NimT family MFS transporter [Halalkalibacter kiskunsagensis]|uniref:CynX/NimT family MFS transporter n=1 Tax=Halalkalibacter kiskunsagensis TaxID=1548599 RepID=A0ABV6KDW8_9BACI